MAHVVPLRQSEGGRRPDAALGEIAVEQFAKAIVADVEEAAARQRIGSAGDAGVLSPIGIDHAGVARAAEKILKGVQRVVIDAGCEFRRNPASNRSRIIPRGSLLRRGTYLNPQAFRFDVGHRSDLSPATIPK